MGELYYNEDEKSRVLMNELNKLPKQAYLARQQRNGFNYNPSYAYFTKKNMFKTFYFCCLFTKHLFQSKPCSHDLSDLSWFIFGVLYPAE